MFKFRTKEEEREFFDRDELFDWVKKNYGNAKVGLRSSKYGAVFTVLEYKHGTLLSMDRLKFDGVRFSDAENIPRIPDL